MLAGSGLTPVFPLWQADTARLAKEMTASGLRAVLVCVDPKQLPAVYAGRTFDDAAAGGAAVRRGSLRRERRVPHLLLRRTDVRRGRSRCAPAAASSATDSCSAICSSTRGAAHAGSVAASLRNRDRGRARLRRSARRHLARVRLPGRGSPICPRVTQCEIHGADLPSAQIDAWVRETLASRGTLYTLDEELVRELQPDVILTQQLCDVCAVNYGSVAAFARSLAKPPLVVNLQPSTLEEILADIGRVGAALGATARAEALVRELRGRVQRVAARAAAATSRPALLPDGVDRSALLRRTLEPAAGRPGGRRSIRSAAPASPRGASAGTRSRRPIPI